MSKDGIFITKKIKSDTAGIESDAVSHQLEAHSRDGSIVLPLVTPTLP